jgi:hypothetical protein
METNSVNVTFHSHYCDQDSGQMTGNPKADFPCCQQANALIKSRHRATDRSAEVRVGDSFAMAEPQQHFQVTTEISDRAGSHSRRTFDDERCQKRRILWSNSEILYSAHVQNTTWKIVRLPFEYANPDSGNLLMWMTSSERSVRLDRTATGNTPEDLRVLDLRPALERGGRLRLNDFDWRAEMFCVNRSKRGGIQQFPIQYEVGDAILKYLCDGRPRFPCWHIFLMVQLPYRPLAPSGIGSIVERRMNPNGRTNADGCSDLREKSSGSYFAFSVSACIVTPQHTETYLTT